MRAEKSGINLYAEHSLHDALKRLAAGSEGRIEVEVEGRIADAVRPDGELVEVQTAGLGSLQAKVRAWVAAGYRVRVQYPLAVRTTIRRIDATSGELMSTRRSPKKRRLWDLFDELAKAPAMISTPGLTFEVLSVEVTDWRRVLPEPVRRGRFMRSFVRADRSLDAVLSSREFTSPADWLALLPAATGEGGAWTSASLGAALEIPADEARKVLYSLARAGLLEAGPRGGPGGAAKRYAIRRSDDA